MESDDKITPTSPEPSELSELSENSDNSEPSELSVPKKRRPLWIRILKWTGITLLSLVLLIIILVGVALFYLTPERLTPLVNKYASEYLNADVKAQRVELTFWSTFPRLNVQVDGLTIVSRALDVLPAKERKALPADADSLLTLQRFTGGIHIMKMISGDISLYDVELTNPTVNLFIANDSVANYDIVPPSGEEEKEPSPMPSVSINRFALNGSMPVRYRAPADSIDFAFTISRTELKGADAPAYAIALGGSADRIMPSVHLPALPFSLDGNINWDIKNPDHIALSDFTLSVLGIEALFNADVDMSSALTVNEFDVSLPRIDVGALTAFVPGSYLGPLSMLDTDLRLSFDMRLLKPYAPAVSTIPQLEIKAKATASQFNLERLRLNRLNADITAVIDGSDLDRSVVTVTNLDAAGQAVDVKLKGKVTHLMTDPSVDGSFEGSIAFSRLPRQAVARLPFTIAGTLNGQADMRFSISQLSAKRFHRARIDGKLSLSDFRLSMNDGSMDTYIRDARFRLGSSSSVRVGDLSVDSLLTASLTVDTAMFAAPGLSFQGRDMAFNVGSRNVASSSDTSQINPLGGSLTAGLINLVADSSATRLRLRDASMRGVLRRFENNTRAPQLDLNVEAHRIAFRDNDMRASLRDGKAHLTLHPRARRPMSPRMRARVDSLAAIYPDLSTDSLTRMARRMMARSRIDSTASGRENIDFAIDNSLATWLRTWQLTGDLTAARGRLYTPYFPLRNTLTGLDMSFSTDSLVIRNAEIKSGRSDFRISGSVRNISRALTSKRRHTPIEIDFAVSSDTIDINDITATMIRGAAHTRKVDTAVITGEIADLEADDDDLLAEPVAEAEAAAVVIPSNVSATLRMNAAHVRYGDIWLRNFDGGVNIYDGAISLERLHALTDMGAVDLSALYSAPRASDISFAAGMKLRKFNLRKFLAEVPQIDSVLPMLKEVEGVVDAEIAMTTDLDSLMNIRIPSLDMALRLSGDSLVLLDSETFRTVAKWLMFKNKKRNMIDHMDVEIAVHNGWVDLYPVVFDMDRYRLGVVGNNDMDFNLDYHVAVLKSPLPFKFGINIKGTPEKMKIRLGKARLNEKSVASKRQLTDSIRVNLMQEMRKVFRRGVRTAGSRGLRVQREAQSGHQSAATLPEDIGEQFSRSDSITLIREGLIERPAGFVMPEEQADSVPTRKKKKKK